MKCITGANAACRVEREQRGTVEVDRLHRQQPHVVGDEALEPSPRGARLTGVEVGGALAFEETESDFVLSPGAEGIIGLGLFSVSAEVRYNKVFADGDADALIMGVGVGFSL